MKKPIYERSETQVRMHFCIVIQNLIFCYIIIPRQWKSVCESGMFFNYYANIIFAYTVYIIIIIISLLSPHCWGTGLPYGLHIRRTGQNLLRGPSAGWWVLTTANTAGTNGLKCLRSTEDLEITIFGYPSNDWPTLLNFRDRTQKRTDHRAIKVLTRWTCVSNYVFDRNIRCSMDSQL
jgi:hypothetical protein